MATVFPSKLFGFSKMLGLLATEVSVLSREATARQQHVWSKLPDTSEQGIVIASDQTGAEAAFVVIDVDVREGEIQGWRLQPTPETVRKLPQLADVKMLVVNT